MTRCFARGGIRTGHCCLCLGTGRPHGQSCLASSNARLRATTLLQCRRAIRRTPSFKLRNAKLRPQGHASIAPLHSLEPKLLFVDPYHMRSVRLARRAARRIAPRIARRASDNASWRPWSNPSVSKLSFERLYRHPVVTLLRLKRSIALSESLAQSGDLS